jgi:hypothetical protein
MVQRRKINPWFRWLTQCEQRLSMAEAKPWRCSILDFLGAPLTTGIRLAAASPLSIDDGEVTLVHLGQGADV